MSKVFVYGTLKKGFRLHSVLEDCKFLGNAIAPKEYTMYQQGKYAGFPFLIKDNKPDNPQCIGELYEVPSRIISRLDQIEGHPTFYKRSLITVSKEDGTEIKVSTYIYQGTPDGMEAIDNFIGRP